jgi:hypothetical protein
MPSQAGEGQAQIRATVTAKSCRGQVRKHYIWYGLTPDRARLNTQCSICLQIGWGSEEGGEKRESHTSLTQVKGKDNAAEASCQSQWRNVWGGHSCPLLWPTGTCPGSSTLPNFHPSLVRPGRVPFDFAPPGSRVPTQLPIIAGPASRRTGRSIRFHDRNSEYGIFRSGRADCRRAVRSPSSPTESLIHPGSR